MHIGLSAIAAGRSSVGGVMGLQDAVMGCGLGRSMSTGSTRR